MSQAVWEKMERRFFLVILIVLLVFLLSAIGENNAQRSDPNYEPVGRGY